MYGFVAVLLAAVLVAPAAQAQVSIDIGIHLPAPPPLVVVPQVPAVQYVPSAQANLFFYSGQYWAFANGAWYVSAGHAGPWLVVAPQFVPRPILLVPVRYYRIPPGHWARWEPRRAPRWHDEWGREWSDRRAWKDRDHDDNRRGKGRGPGHGPGR
jgi:hypothetical protein